LIATVTMSPPIRDSKGYAYAQNESIAACPLRVIRYRCIPRQRRTMVAVTPIADIGPQPRNGR
jgi:hypothetical protein